LGYPIAMDRLLGHIKKRKALLGLQTTVFVAALFGRR
jgi:hypothetical protein